MKKICAIVIVFVVSLAAAAYAQGGKITDQSAAKSAPVEKIVDAGNKTCPVQNEPVNGKDFVVYKGVRYGLCCQMCKEQFLKDPEKYIQKLKEKGEIK